MKASYKIIAILAAFAVLLSGCSPSITKESAEKELVSFMLDFIIQQEIGGTVDYLQTSDQPWVDAPPGENIIIWAPPVDKAQDSFESVNSDEPIKVWLYADNTLVEVTTNQKDAIEEYRQTYMSDSQSDIWAWGYYEFGIMSLSSDNQEATIYVGVFCGPLCGHGVMYTLERNSSGKWEITGSERIWIS